MKKVSLEDEVTTCKAKLLELETHLNNVNQKFQKLEDEQNSCKSERSFTEKKNQEMSNKILELEKMVTKAQNKLQTSEQELLMCKSQINDAEKKIQSLTQNIPVMKTVGALSRPPAVKYNKDDCKTQ